MSAPDLFAKIMNASSNVFMIDGKPYQVQTAPTDVYVIVNLTNQISKVVKAQEQNAKLVFNESIPFVQSSNEPLRRNSRSR
jgi:hypothetical protein